MGLLALGGAACTGDDDDGAVPLTTTSHATTTTTTASTTSTTLDFETEVKLAALELIELRNDVFQHPDESRVGEYISGNCICAEAERGFIHDFVTEGSHWTTPPLEPLAIRLDDPNPVSPSFTLIARQPPGSVAAPSGDRPVPEIPIAPLFVALDRNDAGEWRLNGLDEIPLDPAAAQQIIDEVGLP